MNLMNESNGSNRRIAYSVNRTQWWEWSKIFKFNYFEKEIKNRNFNLSTQIELFTLFWSDRHWFMASTIENFRLNICQ